jgi:hypothetical protein
MSPKERNKISIYKRILRYELLTRSSPELSAFQEMTGMPRYPASWKKYWTEAVERPNFSLLKRYMIADTLRGRNSLQIVSRISEKHKD